MNSSVKYTFCTSYRFGLPAIFLMCSVSRCQLYISCQLSVYLSFFLSYSGPLVIFDMLVVLRYLIFSLSFCLYYCILWPIMIIIMIIIFIYMKLLVNYWMGCRLVSFYGTLTIVGHLISNPVYTYMFKK